MKTLLVGECHPDRTFRLADPDAAGETEFEHTVVRALQCAYPAHRCVTFGGTFVLDGDARRPDLALVAKDFSHWFVLEVELTSHSLEGHVLPQVRAFAYGNPQSDCISGLADRLGISSDQAKTLVRAVPRTVAVIANKRDIEWNHALRGLNTQLLVVSTFTTAAGQSAVEIDGALQAVSEHVGFARYSAIDRSLRLPARTRLNAGVIQLVDPDGAASSWRVAVGDGAIWVTKENGVPDIADGMQMQIVRTFDGRLSLRRPRD